MKPYGVGMCRLDAIQEDWEGEQAACVSACAPSPATPAAMANQGGKAIGRRNAGNKRASTAQEECRQRSYDIEYIDDSGAGRSIVSVPALKKQGVPEALVNALAGQFSKPMLFECGGGDI